MFLKRVLPVVALAAPMLFGAAQSSAASLPFCVNTTGYDSSPAVSGTQTACAGAGAQSGLTGFAVDSLNGSYVEKIQVYNDAGTLKFKATILADWNAYIYGGVGISQTGLDNDYNLYAVVTAEGVITGANSFTASIATLDLYGDKTGNTLLGLGSIDNTTLAFTGVDGTDSLLGSSVVLSSGSGTTSASAGTDGFAVLFDKFNLTAPAGETFFIAPRPFYVRVYSDGDINDGQVDNVSPGLFEIKGDLSAEFKIPEPGSLALAGLGLAGLGMFTRRRRA